jgi:predicted nucleic acid-binding protein
MVAWLLGESSVAQDTELSSGLRDELVVVPSHWPVEISNVLRTHVRAKRLSISDFHWIIEQIDLVTIQVEPTIDLDEIGPLALFAAANELTTYDAAYVQLAVNHGLKLATLDRAMRRAAATLGVPLLPTAAE